MPPILNDVRRGFYLDSVALMRLSRQIAARPGVDECGMMMGTPANKRILADAGILAAAGAAAAAGDLVIAIKAKTTEAAEAALTAARQAIDQPRTASGGHRGWEPRTVRAAVAADPAANLAFISVPGAFAAAEARKALQRGLHVMMFSDNVPLAEEVALKRLAHERGLLMMGPDCGTAILDGVALGFANVVPRGGIGLIGASGTGIQEVSCLIASNGGGISHAIGTGGRDLKAEVGGLTTLMAIDRLERDPATTHIVIISKPPSKDVAATVLARVARSRLPFTICFIDGGDIALPPNARRAANLQEAAELALGRPIERGPAPASAPVPGGTSAQTLCGRHARGLFAGGTLCAEAQLIFRDAGLIAASNIPIAGQPTLTAGYAGHTLVDLGDDAYTQGRPHPMIEPEVRDAPLAGALADPETAVVLLDLVLGFGAHADPAGHLVRVLAAAPSRTAIVIASVTGTAADPQSLPRQIATLRAGGILVAPSNAEAARLAIRCLAAPAAGARAQVAS